MDQQRVGTFVQVSELPYMSKRFALKRYLGLTEEEMTDNASLWAEENDVKQKTPTKSSQLRTGGVTQSGIASDLDNLEDPQAPDTGEPPAQTPGATPGQPPVPGTTPGAGGGRT